MTQDALTPALFQPDPGLHIAPIRHHSPACAWALAQMIRDVRPAHVLIEAPSNLATHIADLLHADTLPPVALVSIVKGEHRRAYYYPFTAHSPEFVALHEGTQIGAAIQFIDLPTGHDHTDARDPNHPQTTQEHHFDSGDYIRALCRRLACRDGFELWDHLFEARLGHPDWTGFFTDVGTYCAGIRAATPQAQIEASGDTAREAHMSACIAKALAQNTGPVLAVVGGFHAPALTHPVDAAVPTPKPADSYMIRYSYPAMDALAGYGAGLPQPGYYDALWHAACDANGPPDWTGAPAGLVEGFAAAMADQGHRIPLPAMVEALRMAQGLAAMRGRTGALRHDLMDGLATALVKGETGTSEVWSERLRLYLRGTKLGDVPRGTGAPPLIDDVRTRAKAHRFDLSDSSERHRKLDIRRKDSQLAASRFLHAAHLLDIGFARRESGPDYVQDTRTDLLFEEWRYAWSPSVEARLIDLAALADNLPTACMAHLMAARDRMSEDGTARDLAALVDLLLQGILAGLAQELPPFLTLIAQDMQSLGTFETIAPALRRLHLLTHATGPMRAPDTLDVTGVLRAGYQRLIYVCDDLATSTQDTIPDRLVALRLMNETLAADTAGLLDRAPYDAALARVLRPGTSPEILGAILALSVLAGTQNATVLIHAMRGNFDGTALDETARIGVLRGVLSVAPQLLWLEPGLLEQVDSFLNALPEDAFLNLLPHLRLAFTALNPRETDRLSDRLADLHGLRADSFAAHNTVTEADLQRGLQIDQDLRAELSADGLTNWAAP